MTTSELPRIVIKEYSTFVMSGRSTLYNVDYEFKLYKNFDLANNTIKRTSEVNITSNSNTDFDMDDVRRLSIAHKCIVSKWLSMVKDIDIALATKDLDILDSDKYKIKYADMVCDGLFIEITRINRL